MVMMRGRCDRLGLIGDGEVWLVGAGRCVDSRPKAGVCLQPVMIRRY